MQQVAKGKKKRVRELGPHKKLIGFMIAKHYSNLEFDDIVKMIVDKASFE